MRTKRQMDGRARQIAAGGALLFIVAAVSWWGSRGNRTVNPSANPSPPAPTLAIAESNPRSMNSTAADASQSKPLPRRNHASDSEGSSEETQRVQLHLTAARQLLHEIEARLVKRVLTINTETTLIDHVHLPALTRDQLDPVYTQLSEAGRDFPAGSTGAKLFRDAADKFLFSLGKLPAKHAMRTTDKKTGKASYVVTRLAEDATVTRGENDSLDIKATSIHAGVPAISDEVGHLFGGRSCAIVVMCLRLTASQPCRTDFTR